MSFLDLMKGVWRRLFPIKDIKRALNVKPAITQDMADNIDKWYKCYAGKADWLNDSVKSLRLEKSIVREFSNIVLNEMTVKISSPKLQEIYDNTTKDLNMNLQKGLATGAMVMKPLGADKAQILGQNNFIPLEYDSDKRMTKCIFPDLKRTGNKYFVRFEHHDLDPINGLTINNYAFVSSNNGQSWIEIPLDSVEEWADLETSITYPLMLRPAYGYFRVPVDNTIDESPCGVSVFESALEMIRLADIQFGRLDWEFESGERGVFANESLLKKKKLARLKKRLFHSVDSDDENLIKEFSPQLRHEGFIAGLDTYKRNIEFEVGLSYGDISNPQSVDKTAEEIKTSKQRKYNTVTAIQENLKDCLEDFVFALAFYNEMATQKYDFICNFKDSILTDEDKERQRDKEDVALGVMPLEEYRAKWYSEDIETAKSKLPKTADVID